MKNIKITGEAVSAAEEAAAAFLADLKKSIKEKGYHPKQGLIGSLSALARMEQPKGVDWTVVILTCQYKDSVEVFQRGREPFALTLP